MAVAAKILSKWFELVNENQISVQIEMRALCGPHGREEKIEFQWTIQWQHNLLTWQRQQQHLDQNNTKVN